MATGALLLSHASAPPVVSDLAHQPARVQQLVALILRHAVEICAYETGSLELNFNQESVRGKLVQYWPVV